MATFSSATGVRAGGTTVLYGDRLELVAATIPTSYDLTNGLVVATGFTTIREALVTRAVIGGVAFAVSAISGGDVTIRAWRQLPAGSVAAHTHTYDKTNTPISTPTEQPSGVTVATTSGQTTGASGVGTAGATAFIDGNPAVGAVSVNNHRHDLGTHTHTFNTLYDHKHTLAFTSTASGSASPALTGTENQLQQVANATDLQAVTGAASLSVLVIGV